MGDNRQSDGVSGEEGIAPPADCVADKCEPLDMLLEQKKKLEQLNGWFDIALNNMVRGLSMFDADQRLIVCNSSYRQMYGLPEELTRPGTPLADIVRYHVKRETGRDGAEEVARQAKWLAEHVAKLAKGRSFSHVQNLRDGRKFLVTYQPLADGGWVDIQEDITEKRRSEERIEWLARHDALTGVANRFHFRETFEKALQELANGSSVALHWLDLDRFKEVNDTLGHPIGDALLKAVAQRLRSSIRNTDFLARLGGDEFAIIQAGGRGGDQCERLAKRVLQALSKPYHVLGHTLSITASIGIVKAPEHGKAADELLKNADVALYSVKSTGRQGFEIFHCDSGQKVEVQRRLEIDIHTALRRRQFELHYQPILSLKTRHVTGCEALLRWRHPEHGLIPPDEFLPIAERTGDIVEIGGWVLAEACREAARWPNDVKVNVNLSAAQLENSDLPRVISQALGNAELDAKRLELEIAEATVSRDAGTMCEVFDKLRALGTGIALDDFGKTNGSLGHLQKFRFDKVKIDQALVRGLPLRADSAAIVKAVAMLAQTLGILSVAEGVETLDELDFVTSVGCNKVQGFYFSQPVPAVELDAVLSKCPQKFALAA